MSNYSNIYTQLSKSELIQWAILDTFDMLSPEFDNPQSLNTLRSWVKESGLKTIYCGKGNNGYVLVAEK